MVEMTTDPRTSPSGVSVEICFETPPETMPEMEKEMRPPRKGGDVLYR
jgi:hypothetical protein